jgi:K+-sensing histidine kinase KdpD
MTGAPDLSSEFPALSQELQDVTEALAAAKTQQDVYEIVLKPALMALDAISGTVLLVSGSGGRVSVAARQTRPEEAESQAFWSDGLLEEAGPIRDVLTGHRPLFFEQAGDLALAYPELAGGGLPVPPVASAVLPMFLDAQPLGVIIFDFREPHPFTLAEKRFLASLAPQCAVALGRARATAELERRVNERTAQLEEETQAQAAFVAFTETAGTQTDVMALAEQAVQVLQARFRDASVGYYAPESTPLGQRWKARVWSDNVPDEVLAQMTAGFPEQTPLIAEALRTQRPVFVDDWDPLREQVAHTGMYGTVGTYPLMVAGEVRGLLSVGLRSTRQWRERDRMLVRAVGRSLTLALERSEQARQLDKESAALGAFMAFTEQVGSEMGVDTLVQRAVQLLRETRSVDVTYFEREDGVFRVKLWSEDFPAKLLERSKAGYALEEYSFALALQERQTVFIDDWSRSGLGVPESEINGAVAFQPFFVGGALTSMLVMGLRDPEGHWTERDKGIFRAVGRGLALALDRTEQARQRQEEARAQDAFVAFTEAASHTEDLNALLDEGFRTLQTLFPGSTAGLNELQGDLWRIHRYTGEMPPELVAVLDAGLPLDTPSFAEAAQTRRAVFVEHWDAAAGGIQHSQTYQTIALYPIEQHGEVCALLTIGLRGRPIWTERDRSVVLAVGRSFSLLYDRVSASEALRMRQQEAESRSQAIEGFSQLTRDLGVQGDSYALIQRAQEVALSLLSDGFALYLEPEHGRWRLRSQVGQLNNPEVQAMLEAGLPLEQAQNLWQPWHSGQPVYQDNYDLHTDGLEAHLQSPLPAPAATASLPLLVGGVPTGVFALVQYGARVWTRTDQVVLESVMRSLSLALERAQSVTQLAQRSADLERINDELRVANEELEAFAYSVSHDLRTPVRHIVGFNDLLRKALGTDIDERAERYLGVVEQSASRMNTLIDTLLDLSRTSRQPLTMGPVELGPLVAAVRAELELEHQDRRVEWAVSPLPQVIGDMATLRQVMINLMSNALKYTRTRPTARIEVKAEDRGSEWVISVSDNGVGFDARYADRLFGVFQRLHRPEEFEGVGVGLANVRRIVARHGGRVWAKGQLGEGATFVFSLPRQERRAPEQRGPLQPERPPE